MLAPAPAPDSTATLAPSVISFFTVSGVAATRLSAGALSLSTAMRAIAVHITPVSLIGHRPRITARRFASQPLGFLTPQVAAYARMDQVQHRDHQDGAEHLVRVVHG